MTIRSIAACVLAVAVPALIGGCGAGINSSQALPSLNGPATAARSGKQRVRFVIRVPRKKHRGRSANYLSYATKSMRVSVSLGGATKFNKVVNLTAGTQGCTGTDVNANCEFSAALAPANGYVASFTTYDAANGAGHVLSVAANAAFNVVKGETGVVGVTLDGVPTKLQTFSAGTNAFYAITLDADGNVIVGPGAPHIAATGRGGNVVTITQPTAAAPNKIVVAPILGGGGNEFIDITASYPITATNGCAVTGAVCTFPAVANATAGQEVFLTDYYDNYPTAILGFRVPLSSGQKPDTKIFSYSYPWLIGFDSSDNLLAPEYSGSQLLKYAPPYTAETALSSGGISAEGMAVAADGKVFVTNSGHVGEYVPPYSAAATTFTGFSGAEAIAVDASDRIYVTGGTTLEVFSPPYTGASTPTYTVTLGNTAQYAARVSGNKLYVGEQNRVEVYTLPITTNTPPVLKLAGSVDYAYGLAIDAHGNVYVANYYGGTNNTGSVLIYHAPLSDGQSPNVTLNAPGYAQDVVLDSAGNVYATAYEGGIYGGGALYEFKPPFTSSSTPAATLGGDSGVSLPYGDALAITKSGSFRFTLNP